MRVEHHYTYLWFWKTYLLGSFSNFFSLKNLPTEVQNFTTFNVAEETSNADQ